MILVSHMTLRHALRTASRDVTRSLCGVWFERGSDGITFAVSSDGHRQTVIAYRESDLEGPVPVSVPLPDEEAFVPTWLFDAAEAAFQPKPDALFVANALVSPFDDAAKHKNKTPVRDVREILARMEPGKPAFAASWRQVIPGYWDHHAKIDRKAALAAVRVAEDAAVRFEFKDGKVSLDKTVVGNYHDHGVSDLYLERRYAEDALKTMTGRDFTLTANGSLDPVLFSDEHGARVIVMPRKS